ncbi:protein mono-ADP-ribosyltransferase PARP14-like isoform X1 [Scomber scombrus]|uniref:protein mono-ADP-ribosyltransferase PARP14-like isoform X1 n=1 Tax=Scomber scombrus TaxID=13677 RepID=UPI002DDAE30F|nr:protein mono-ADP-ribosyltransferase PARP14-like isoform X1 [Scomber scombrus]
MAVYTYFIFFESPDLDEGKRKKIETYFNIQRKSGGGDCSSVKQIKDNVYSIAFRDREAQQRVLQKSAHVLEIAGHQLVLTVRDNQDNSSPNTTSTPGQPVRQSQQAILDSSLPPSGEEYELQLDTYLLCYLKESPKAGKEFESKLASAACSAQLYPDEGKVLVKNLAQPGAGVKKWEAEVDKLFESVKKQYLCHYETDSHKVKALLQSCKSQQITDEVKVYNEAGMAVVVGEQSQVNSRLMDIEDLYVKVRGSRLSERQTSTRRLGKAKLGLLWKEIEHGLQRDFAGVKVTQGDAGQLVLEGSVEEILKAGDWISEKEKLVFERSVANMSPHLLAFLRKAYGGPGPLGDFLGVGDKLEIELRDTELRLFSLFTGNLDDTEKALHSRFKELNIDLPNCSMPSELRKTLETKANEMNQGKCRVRFMFSADKTVCLLGHTKEVEELNEAVIQFILDQASIEGKVILPFPDLVQLLPELLHLHGFDYSGVTFHPLTSSSRPMMMLEGPSRKVTEVRNRLGPFLDSLVEDRVSIDLPGAVRYFLSHSGRDNLLNVSHSQKCIIKLHEQPHSARQNLASELNKEGTTLASYCLHDGLQVLVCQGDITKQDADALVNAANEDLDHCGGVAAALSKAGGPEVQKESSAIVKQVGKIPTGDVVVTTGGNLNCKKLLHAVGPVGGQSGSRERVLLEKTAESALDLAEQMEFKSIAMPCISSGIFGVPVRVCSEAIVTAVKKFGSQGGRSLSKIILIDNRGEVVRAMQEACDRLLQPISTGNRAPRDFGFPMDAAAQDTTRGATAGNTGGCVLVQIIQGTLETQQVDVLVSPMASHDPLSTRVGNILSNMVGPQLTAKFHTEAGGATLPGDTVLVEGLPALRSKAVIFLNLVSWDNNQHGTAVQALRQGINKILARCENRGFCSVAFPMLGTGAVLRFPHSLASKVLLEEINGFEQSRASRASFNVHIVIHPNDKESSKAFQSAQKTLHLRGFTNDANPDQASFYRHVSVNNDEVTALLGGVKLQMVQGDIINERTDVIVNTTDFSNNPSGVSKAILIAAGPTVQAELAQVGIPADYMCTTGSGLLGCREIIHASFMCDTQMIRKNCKKILKQCETKGYHSAAFPAINTGAAGMDSVKACEAMLDGIASAIRDLKPTSVSLIRIVILQQQVFQTFRSELEKRFGQIATCRLGLKERAKQILKKCQEKCSKTFTSSSPEGETFISSKPQPADIRVIGCGTGISRTIKTDLERLLQQQLIEREVDVHHFSKLDAMEMEAVHAKVKCLGISLEHRRRQSVNGNRARAGARDRSASVDVYVLKGLKEDVLSVTDLVNKAIQKALCEDLQDKDEAMLALTVQWSMQDVQGEWQELSLRDNTVLETAHITGEVSVDVKAPNDSMAKVNLKKREATDQLTGITYRVKRSETEANLPSNWEPMDREGFKKVELQPNSSEYQNVVKGFCKKTKYNICKIERVQNIYLWHAYTVCRERILSKNGPNDLGEKTLYHGSSAESCNCIERDRFDRNFAGKHAVAYGQGVYFAVDADYSAGGYSAPDAAGMKRVYVARVLTGRYTVGNSSMRRPPPRASDPTDCFDSLVNNQQSPSMFVIFHDDQAYPEYLVTFRKL